jgi:hypothetical protein
MRGKSPEVEIFLEGDGVELMELRGHPSRNLVDCAIAPKYGLDAMECVIDSGQSARGSTGKASPAGPAGEKSSGRP